MKVKLKRRRYPGKLIVFEGTDGAGKTTMIAMAKDYLVSIYGAENVIVTKQPTDMSRKTKLFQKMMYCKNNRDVDYRAMQLLTLSDRMQHGFEEIETALRAGKTVVCDRYIYTSVANMSARGYKNEKWFFQAAKHILKPDLVFLAYVPPELAISRIKARPAEATRHLDERLLKRVAEEFKKLAHSNGFIVLDTAQAPNTAYERVEKVLNNKIIKEKRV